MQSDEEQWKKLGIDFYREVPKFPGNKIYAKINIEPESARKLIKNFIVSFFCKYRINVLISFYYSQL